MSSVAVLTPESFAEHRSGLKDQEITGNVFTYFNVYVLFGLGLGLGLGGVRVTVFNKIKGIFVNIGKMLAILFYLSIY